MHDYPPAASDVPSSSNGNVAGLRTYFHARNMPAEWQVRAIEPVKGCSLAMAQYVTMTAAADTPQALWSLEGTASHLRYTDQTEREALVARPAPLGRPASTLAVLIPIRKSATWWAMAQDERLDIYRRSQHMAIGMDYVPLIARQLLHCRDLGGPFDFLTWFEFERRAQAHFLDLLARLRASEEWTYVEREVEVWLTRAMT